MRCAFWEGHGIRLAQGHVLVDAGHLVAHLQEAHEPWKRGGVGKGMENQGHNVKKREGEGEGTDTPWHTAYTRNCLRKEPYTSVGGQVIMGMVKKLEG